MAYETEKKYLVDGEKFEHYLESGFPDGEELVGSKFIRQAYLGETGKWQVLVKASESKNQLRLFTNATSGDFNFNITPKEAQQLLQHESTIKMHHDLGFVSLDAWALRIRVFQDGTGEVCLKERIDGDVRGEVEAPVDPDRTDVMYTTSDIKLSKMRYFIKKGDYTWELDKFEDENKGHYSAELETEDTEYPLLSCIVKELTERKYFNEELARNPISKW